MDEIKLFAKNQKEERIYNQDLGMKFSMEKYAMLIKKSGKWQKE